MTQSIFRSFEYIFQNLMTVFSNITFATGTAQLVIGTIIAMLVVRFIIYPGLKGGVGSSDKVSRRSVNSNIMDAEYKEL